MARGPEAGVEPVADGVVDVPPFGFVVVVVVTPFVVVVFVEPFVVLLCWAHAHTTPMTAIDKRLSQRFSGVLGERGSFKCHPPGLCPSGRDY